jgi:hypothetical protein
MQCNATDIARKIAATERPREAAGDVENERTGASLNRRRTRIVPATRYR